jgi:hypothetical protein
MTAEKRYITDSCEWDVCISAVVAMARLLTLGLYSALRACNAMVLSSSGVFRSTVPTTFLKEPHLGREDLWSSATEANE